MKQQRKFFVFSKIKMDTIRTYMKRTFAAYEKVSKCPFFAWVGGSKSYGRLCEETAAPSRVNFRKIKSRVSHIECGNTQFSLPSIVAIANALNVSVDCFLMDVVDNSHIQFKRELIELFDDCSKDEYGPNSKLGRRTAPPGGRL